MFCKISVLSISQNSLENTCVIFLSFREVAGQKPVDGKGSIVDVRLDSKYALASGRYWKEKLIVENKIQFKI